MRMTHNCTSIIGSLGNLNICLAVISFFKFPLILTGGPKDLNLLPYYFYIVTFFSHNFLNGKYLSLFFLFELSCPFSHL